MQEHCSLYERGQCDCRMFGGKCFAKPYIVDLQTTRRRQDLSDLVKVVSVSSLAGILASFVGWSVFGGLIPIVITFP